MTNLKNLLLENNSKYLDDLLSGEPSLPFGSLPFLILVSSSPTDQDLCEIYTSTIDGCPVNYECNVENSLPTCQ